MSRYYHGSIQKTITAFGNVVSRLRIDQTDSDGSVIRRIRVPIEFEAKEKFVRLVRDGARGINENAKVQMTLPRMSYNIGAPIFDSARATQEKLRVSVPITLPDGRAGLRSRFVRAPWNVDMELVVATRTWDDGFRIIEPIMAMFNPTFTTTVTMIPEIDEKVDITFLLNSLTPEVDVQGDAESGDVRLILWNMSFTAKTWVYGPVYDAGAIRETITTFHDARTNTPLSRVTAEVSPEGAGPDDEWEAIVTKELLG